MEPHEHKPCPHEAYECINGGHTFVDCREYLGPHCEHDNCFDLPAPTEAVERAETRCKPSAHVIHDGICMICGTTPQAATEVSLCSICQAMTHTINGNCGKCGCLKPQAAEDAEREQLLSKHLLCLTGDGPLVHVCDEAQAATSTGAETRMRVVHKKPYITVNYRREPIRAKVETDCCPACKEPLIWIDAVNETTSCKCGEWWFTMPNVGSTAIEDTGWCFKAKETNK